MHERILTFPPPRAGAPLWISLAGESWCDGSYRIARTDSSVCVIEYVIAGRGTLTVDGRSVAPEGGDVYIAPPYTRHVYYSSPDQPWNKVWFNIDGPLVPTLLAAYGLGDVILLKNSSSEPLFRAGLAELEQQRAAPEAVAAAITMKLLSVLGAFQSRTLDHSPEGEAMRCFLEAHLRDGELALSEIARACGRSESQAVRIFRGDFGETPYAYWLRRRMETAALLLENTAQSVKSIAAEMGFADEYYFSRLFKRKIGVAPSEYRQR